MEDDEGDIYPNVTLDWSRYIDWLRRDKYRIDIFNCSHEWFHWWSPDDSLMIIGYQSDL